MNLREYLKPYLKIFRLSFPLALGMMNNAVLQFTDRAFLARESMSSLEAALPASLLAYVALCFFQSVVAYAGTFVAQYYGAKDYGRCRQSYHAGMWIALASGIIMIAILPLGNLVLAAVANGPEIAAKQQVYFDICAAGGFFLFGQMAAQSYFTGLGKTRIVLWVNIIGNVINVALDPVLIFGWLGCPRMGIAGAAWATVVSTAVQWIVLAIAAARVNHATTLPTGSIMPLVRRILRFGLPSGGYSVLNILSYTIFVFVTDSVGHVEAAVSNAAFSVCYLLIAPTEGFALGASALVGHDRGNGDDAAAMLTGTRVVILGSAIALVMSALVVLLRHPIIDLFAPADPEVALQFHKSGSVLFIMMCAWEVFDAIDIIVSGALKGAGDTRFVMLWMLVNAFALWIPLVWFVHIVSNDIIMLWSTTIIYMLVICVGSVWRWHSGRWKRIKLI